jgi:hypothetical protein
MQQMVSGTFTCSNRPTANKWSLADTRGYINKKIFNYSIQIMLKSLRMVNWSLLFSYLHDKNIEAITLFLNLNTAL